MLTLFFLPLLVNSVGILFEDDFENGLGKWGPVYNRSFSSAQISECIGKDGLKQHCMQLTQQMYGGDAVSIPIDNPIYTKLMTIEFGYKARFYQGKHANSSLFFGYTYKDNSTFKWTAVGDPTKADSIESDIPPVWIQDIEGQVVQVVSVIKPEPGKPIRLVLEDFPYTAERQTSTGYEILYIKVHQGGICQGSCDTCTMEGECIKCPDNEILIGGICLPEECKDDPQIAQVEDEFKIEVITTDVDYLIKLVAVNVNILTCYQTEVYQLSQDKKKTMIDHFVDEQFPHQINIVFNRENITSLNCPTTDIGFDCNFVFSLNQGLYEIFHIEGSQIITIEANDSLIIKDFQPKIIQLGDQPPIVIVIDSNVLGCNINSQTNRCDFRDSNLTVRVMEPFKVKLSITDPAYENWTISPSKVYLSGNGTLVDVKIINSTKDKGSIIYLISVPLMPYEGVDLVVTGLLAPPTRILEDDSKKYQSNGKIRVNTDRSAIISNPSTNSSSTSSSVEQNQVLLQIVILSFYLLINI